MKNENPFIAVRLFVRKADLQQLESWTEVRERDRLFYSFCGNLEEVDNPQELALDKTQNRESTELYLILKADTRKTLVSDGDGHNFLIPVRKLSFWQKLVEGWEDDSAYFHGYPKWATRVEGGLLTFTNAEYNGIPINCEE